MIQISHHALAFKNEQAYFFKTGKWNAAMPKQAQGAACTSMCCGCFTGRAGGGALGPMPWGTAPGIPAAMGTLWAATGPRVSIALGSRPAGSKRLTISARKPWNHCGNKLNRIKKGEKKVSARNHCRFQKQLTLFSYMFISNYGSINYAGTGNKTCWSWNPKELDNYLLIHTSGEIVKS